MNLKRIFGEDAIAIFVKPPSFEILEQRLRSRNTETEEKISMRLSKARQELETAPQFDAVLINDNLDWACEEAYDTVRNFIKK